MSDGRKVGLLKAHEDLVTSVQRVADSVWIVIAHLLASWIYRDPWRPVMTTATVVALVVFRLISEANGLYRPWRSERLSGELRTLFTSWALATPALFVMAFATKTTADFSRVVSFLWFVGALVLMGTWRLLVRLVLRSLRQRGYNVRRVAILGATRSAGQICQAIADRPSLGLRLVGLYDDRSPDRHHRSAQDHCPFGGRTEQLVQAARAGEIDMVYIALPLRAEARVAEVLRALSDTTATVYFVADFFIYDLLHARWGQLGGVPVVSIHDSPFRGVNGWLKRGEDIALGTMILAIIGLPMLVIGLLVKLTSPGPAFFRQRRYGLNGREIRVLKFRTMSVCEDGAVVQQATRNDPRVTPLGRLLRRTSLDELPQFLQVLTGEMSIVGPRPHAVAHNEQYRALIHGYMLRHKVKPGITGWAQVNGWRGETDQLDKMEKRVRHDLEYIQNWSLLWDLKIILLTMFGAKKNVNAF